MKKSNQEINALRAKKNQTFRPVSSGLEGILYRPLKVLDKGFVRVVDYMGNDESVVQAARVSYGKGTKKKSEDEGLIRYLLRHRHTTPFEMCEIKIHVKLPIFIARQWIRHRTASINEYSARYSILEDEFYIPKKNHLAQQSLTNKQGRGNELDEATSNVDLETESQIQNGIKQMTQGRTSIIIAHRLSTLMHVDKVLVLKDGEIVEFGKREELLKNKGVFYKLCESQIKLEKIRKD